MTAHGGRPLQLHAGVPAAPTFDFVALPRRRCSTPPERHALTPPGFISGRYNSARVRGRLTLLILHPWCCLWAMLVLLGP